MANELTDLRPQKVSIVDKGANGKEFLVIKALTPATQTGENDMDFIALSKAAGVTPEQFKSVVGTLVAANKDATVATVAAAVTEADKPKSSEVVALEKAAADRDAKIVALEKAVADSADARQTDILVAKAKASYSHTPVKPEDYAKRIKALGGADSDTAKAYDAELAQTEELLAKSKLFSEIGSSMSGDAGTSAQFESLVTKALADNPKLTREQAFARVYKSKEGRAIHSAAAH